MNYALTKHIPPLPREGLGVGLLGVGSLVGSSLNCPYYYEPHPLCRKAMAEVFRSVEAQNLTEGKMLGVLVVEDSEGKVGYLKAFSGQIDGRGGGGEWVPAVFDYLDEDGYFCTEEREISGINARIKSLLASPELADSRKKRQQLEAEAAESINAYRQVMAASKARRNAIREAQGTATAEMTRETESQKAEMIRESQFQKAELRRLRQSWQARIDDARSTEMAIEQTIKDLRRERQQRSEALQQWLFSNFVMVNGHGEKASLLDIFSKTKQRVPPSGAGECCAPKLLQHAFLNNLRPVAIAECWYGPSPVGEVRRHGEYYPACQGKCRPILDFMLQGIDVAPNPLEAAEERTHLDIIYEDEWLIAVNKPSGMLSAPGRGERLSAIEILQAQRPDIAELYNVHRLDMATSGILLMAKALDMQRTMHQMFARREVKKRYTAVTEGRIRDGIADSDGRGRISLPIAPDYINRPRQRVDYRNGKEAVTLFHVVGTTDGHTILHLFPLTGRTHQLRIHCAHAEGLASPIIGDDLYGSHASHLCLHADRLEFVHPVTHLPLTLSCPEL